MSDDTKKKDDGQNEPDLELKDLSPKKDPAGGGASNPAPPSKTDDDDGFG